MKSCGCILYYAFYPCGHQSSEWVYCPVAKAKNLLRREPTACSSYTAMETEPDLQDTCGSTCLTQPYQCKKCGASKQVGWICSQCQATRAKDSPVWGPCACPNPNHKCHRFALGKTGEAVCKSCLTGVCANKPGAQRQIMASLPMPTLHWKCHSCTQKNSTPANRMKCGGRGVYSMYGCGHTRCGNCRALFPCTCGCGCTVNFLEGGPGICQSCLESCSGL